MDDAAGMGLGEGVGQGNGVLEGFGETQAFLGDDVVQGPAGDVLHDDVVDAVLAGDVVDGNYVGMVKGAGGLGFLDEAALAVGVGDAVGGEDLEGDQAVEPRVAGLVDDTHAALAQLLEDGVVAEGLAGHGVRCAIIAANARSPPARSGGLG